MEERGINRLRYRGLLNQLLYKAKDEFEESEAFLIENKEVNISLYKGEIDKFSIAESGGLSLRGTRAGRMGYAYTEKIDEEALDILIEEASENRKYIDDKEPEVIFEGSKSYKSQDNYSQALEEVGTEEKINFLKKLEAEALRLDKRVFSVNNCGYQESYQKRHILNSKGVDLEDRTNGAFAFISVVVKEGEDTKTGLSYRIVKDFSELDYKKMAKEAVKNASSMLGAESIKSDNYPIVFENKTFANFLSAFSSIFSAENVQKGLSGLKGKLGEDIANPILTIVDDPFLKDGFASKNFDDEGTSTQVTKLIDKGKLSSLIYNWKAAKKDKVQSTGNASRSYKGQISISPTNLYVQKGETEFTGLIDLKEGVFINDLQGLHSGLNPVSGDFSLSAAGFMIEDGQLGKPVNQITIAGNLYELLKDIEAIGKDLEFSLPGASYIGSPSVRVSSLSVSGK